MTVLWTDIAVFFLVFFGLVVAWRSSKKEHLRRPWEKVFNSKTGVASLTILLIFILIGTLDSARIQHYKTLDTQELSTQAKTLSLLDIILTPIRTRVEKTYSEPFAHMAYAKEMGVDEAGQQKWRYPRLSFAGAHLSEPNSEKSGDILLKVLLGFSFGMLAWLALVLILSLLAGKFILSKGSSGIRVCLLTLLGVFFIVGCIAMLGPYYHILGTDKVGEDVLYQAIKSIRTGLVIGSLTTIVMLPIAIGLGLMAGFFRGWVDDVIQYVYTTLSSIPAVLLIAAAILMAQVYMANNPELFTTVEDRADMRLFLLCMILGITSWTGLCRLLRAETLKIREMDYVVAAQALGVKKAQLLKRHVLPNVMHLVMITVVLDFSGLVLAEAVLSYINIGVDPSTYSWGNMINTSRLEMAREPIVWWSLTAAFIFMFTLVLAANLFADVVRDAFDPHSNS
ncbi:MAG: peptide ABC transporter permease [Cycloclasticus sp. symbiont of Poecilosclerida sp. N]|nr:MAG: peptide ABC transporter permease [Cycloclasticus sp. symbiont of Poecilosclerida sp. N]